MKKTIELISDRADRIDKFLSEEIIEITRSAVQNLILGGWVSLNDKPAVKNLRIKPGDRVCICFPDPQPTDVPAQNIPLEIIYEDMDLLVVNKPKGMVVHPAPGNYNGTMVNALLFHAKDSLSGIGGKIRPGIVHRIDKDTSGLLIVAKNDASHNNLAAQIKGHTFTREYRAVVYGTIKTDVGSVDAPIGRSPKERKNMAVISGPSSREAKTNFEVLERLSGFTYVKLRLETGRTHQIRVHMAYIGHPVAGDVVYGPKKILTELHGQCLHAGLIGFIHPRTNAYMEFEAPLPPCFSDFLEKLRKKV